MVVERVLLDLLDTKNNKIAEILEISISLQNELNSHDTKFKLLSIEKFDQFFALTFDVSNRNRS